MFNLLALEYLRANRDMVSNELLTDGRVWDYVPGWGCWVASYYSRPTGSSAACESKILFPSETFFVPIELTLRSWSSMVLNE